MTNLTDENISEELTETHVVYPLCFPVQQLKFYESFTIILLIYFIILFNFGISVFIFEFYISGVTCMVYSLIASIWILCNLYLFKKNKQFGNNSSFWFSLCLFISNLFKIGIFVCFVTDNVISEIHHIYYFKDISPTLFFFLIFGVFTPLLGYFFYLCTLYYFAIYNECQRIKKEMVFSFDKMDEIDHEENKNLISE